MARYRKKPVVIDAVQLIRIDGKEAFFSDCGQNWPEDWPTWEIVEDALLGPCLEIETLEGQMLARPGDYIIRGVKGEFYPCKPDIFAATYEEEKEPFAFTRDIRLVELAKMVAHQTDRQTFISETMKATGGKLDPIAVGAAWDEAVTE